jgi:release factor glutamine methyltransferase
MMWSDPSAGGDDLVYHPEADTLLLLRCALREVRPEDRVLEVGTGSGFIARELSSLAGSVVATDINPHAVANARQMGVECIRNDLFSGICAHFDLVIFNPPYLPTRPEERLDDWLEYALDGGPDGRVQIARFIEGVSRVLAPGGRVLLLVSSLTGIDEVRKLFAAAGLISLVMETEVCEGEALVVMRSMRDLCRIDEIYSPSA